MRVIRLTTKNQQEIINQTLAVLKAGGVVIFPSDTVYGLLADATNPKAIDKLLAFKDRPAGKAISVFVTDKKMAEKYVILNQNANNVINNLLPGPFTVVCKYRFAGQNLQPETEANFKNANNQKIPNLAAAKSSIVRSPNLKTIDPRLPAENGTLGIRIPDFPLMNKLVSIFGLPLTATSANLSGKPPVHSIPTILKTLSQKKKLLLDLIIDAGTLPKN
ncbi:MAG: L-threonylcarbamoyladenylate synthase, partial [Microgenomates group bacterium]